MAQPSFVATSCRTIRLTPIRLIGVSHRSLSYLRILVLLRSLRRAACIKSVANLWTPY